MDDRKQAYLRNLCRIFEIPVTATDPNPELALQVLARLYLVPTLKTEAERYRAANEIRANLKGQFDSYSVFMFRTARIATTMQILPHWYSHVNEDTETLIAQFKNIELATSILSVVAVGSVGGAVVAGGVEASKTGSAGQGATKTLNRLAGKGPAVEELERRMGTRFGPGTAARASSVIMVGAVIAYYGGLERMEEIRTVLMHRHQKGEMSDAQFREVFGSTIEPADIQKYWEM